MTVICTVCNKTFSKNGNLVRHFSRFHSDSVDSRKSKLPVNCSFICASCGQTFSRKQNLKRHILLVHSSNINERCKIVCLYCVSNGTSKKFVTRKLLLEHCVKVHNVELQKEIKTFSSKIGMKKSCKLLEYYF